MFFNKKFLLLYKFFFRFYLLANIVFFYKYTFVILIITIFFNRYSHLTLLNLEFILETFKLFFQKLKEKFEI